MRGELERLGFKKGRKVNGTAHDEEWDKAVKDEHGNTLYVITARFWRHSKWGLSAIDRWDLKITYKRGEDQWFWVECGLDNESLKFAQEIYERVPCVPMRVIHES